MKQAPISEAALDALNDALPEFEDYDSQFETVPDDQALRRLAALCGQLISTRERIEELEAEVAAHKQTEKRLSEIDIPDKLLELGMTGFYLQDGTHVSTKPDVYCGISDQNKEQAFAWLRENGFGDIIKNHVSVALARGHDKDAARAMKLLVDEGFAPEQKEAVHPQTLKAFIKERDANQEEIPDELFSVHRVNKTKVER